MVTGRVDKGWQKQGLGGYSTEAIFGTLKHYGVELDEAAFRSLAGQKYPVRIAEQWHQSWKGTGQFGPFPLAAAEELFRRLESGRLMPVDFSKALVELMEALEAKLDKAPSPVAERFAAVEALREKIPTRDGKPMDEFISEVVFNLGEAFRAFNELAEALAKGGQLEEAERLATLEEFLFPVRRGTVRALLLAARGERPKAIDQLCEVAKDPGRNEEDRLMAIDALIHLSALAEAEPLALPLFEAAEKDGDLHLALDLGERLYYFADKLGMNATRRALLSRVEKIAKEHELKHPGHHHH